MMYNSESYSVDQLSCDPNRLEKAYQAQLPLISRADCWLVRCGPQPGASDDACVHIAVWSGATLIAVI